MHKSWKLPICSQPEPRIAEQDKTKVVGRGVRSDLGGIKVHAGMPWAAAVTAPTRSLLLKLLTSWLQNILGRTLKSRHHKRQLQVPST